MSLLAVIAVRKASQLHRMGYVVVRCAATSTPATTSTTTAVAAPPKKTGLLASWGDFHTPTRMLEPFPKDFKEFPERDIVNFPHVERKNFHPKVRMGFLPDSWFNFLYDKTGVTGPYLLGWGFTLFLLQKEILVWDHEMARLPYVIFTSLLVYRLGGKYIAAYFDKERLGEMDSFHEFKFNQTKAFIDGMKEEEELSRSAANIGKYLFDAKKENAQLQLEAVYRQRVAHLHKEVKRKLEYLVEVEEAKKRFEHKHMINWIMEQVLKSISAQQEQAILKQCVIDLKTLTPK